MVVLADKDACVHVLLANYVLSSVLQIRLKHGNCNCELHFLCDKWISMHDGDMEEDFILELPVVRPDIAPLKGSDVDDNF